MSDASGAGPLADRDVRYFLTARFVSSIALQIQSLAVGWQVYARTGHPLDLGLVGLAQFVPAIGLSLFGGAAADRFDRRRILLACHLAYASCSLALWSLARAPRTPLGAVYAVLTLFGAARAFAGPASQAFLPDLVPRAQFARAVAWGSTVSQGASILGPALGGVLYGAARRAAPVYAISGTLSLAALGIVASMPARRRAAPAGPAPWTRLLDGVRYVRAQPVILGAISLDLFAVLLGGATALLPVFARDYLRVGPWGLGALRSAPALGAALMAFWLARHPLAHRVGTVMLASVGVFGVATVVFGLSRNLALSLLALVVLGASDMISVVVRQTLVQIRTPAEMRGRVSAVNLVFIGASNELGEFESGLTAAWLGTVPAVVLGGVGTVLVVALWTRVFPALAHVDRLAPDEG